MKNFFILLVGCLSAVLCGLIIAIYTESLIYSLFSIFIVNSIFIYKIEISNIRKILGQEWA